MKEVTLMMSRRLHGRPDQNVNGHADDGDRDDNRQYPADKAHELLRAAHELLTRVLTLTQMCDVYMAPMPKLS